MKKSTIIMGVISFLALVATFIIALCQKVYIEALAWFTAALWCLKSTAQDIIQYLNEKHDES